MEKYHIYDEIGKGEFSQVFKGREKKKIEYVAIKRVEKAMMSKIVNEVQTMHRLESPHTVRFYDWYETKNNLWLILEYCTGADLKSLLEQDGHLPETAVRMFGVDIMAALAYLHSSGLIHGDLRPANMLIDEFGVLKLSDFKYVKKIPKTLEAAVAGDGHLAHQLPPAARGYLAPECLSLEGVPSFASDLWSVGCVLYQLRRGYLPFGTCESDTAKLPGVDASIAQGQQVLRNIQRSEHVFAQPLASSGIDVDYSKVPAVTAVFADLVSWLLEKNPIHRADWSVVPSHPFWMPKVCSSPGPLPTQPAFDALAQQAEAAEIVAEAQYFETKYDGEESSSGLLVPSISNQYTSSNAPSRVDMHSPNPDNRRHSSNRDGGESNGNSSMKDIERTPIGSRNQRREVNDTPVKSPGGSRANATISPLSMGGAKDDHPSALLFCAHDAQVRPIVNNREIEVIEKAAYKASGLPCAPISTQYIASLPPTELEAHLTKIYKALHKAVMGCIANCTGTSSSGAGSAAGTPSPGVASSVSAASAQQQQVQIYADKMNSLLGYLCSLAPSVEIANVVMNTQFLSVLLRILLLVVNRHEYVQSLNLGGSGMSSRTSPGTKVGGALPNSGRVAAVGNIQNAITGVVTDSACLAATVLALMLRHATYVQPVHVSTNNGGNSSRTPDKRGGGHAMSSPGSPSLQQNGAAFDGPSTSQSPNIVTALIATMHVVDADIAAAQGGGRDAELDHTPRKHTVSSASRITRSPGSGPTAGTSPNSNLDSVLRLKLRLTAALGELAFYVSAQDTTPSDDAQAAPNWQLPVEVWDILIGSVNMLTPEGGKSTRNTAGRGPDDIAEITKHYATKTIENILTTGGGDVIYSHSGEDNPHNRMGSQFSSQILGMQLLETSLKASSEPLQVSSAMAFGHLLNYLCQSVLSRSKANGSRAQQYTLSCLLDETSGPHNALFLQCIRSLKDATMKIQQAYLNIINVVLCYSVVTDSEGVGAATIRKILDAWRARLCDAKTLLLPVVTALMEQSSSTIVRAKSLLCVQLIDACCRSDSLAPRLAKKN